MVLIMIKSLRKKLVFLLTILLLCSISAVSSAENSDDFYVSALFGNIEKMADCLANGDSINEPDESGKTGLLYAVNGKSAEMVEFLINKGADVNLYDADKRVPIYYAAQSGNLNIIRLLAEGGADVNQRYQFQTTPLMAAFFNDKLDAFKVLMGYGANIDALTNEEKVLYKYFQKVVNHKNSYIPDIEFEQIAKGGLSLLHAMTYMDSTDKVEFLLDNGANIDTRDFTGDTPLANACSQGNLNMTMKLVERGAFVLAHDNSGYPAASIANNYPGIDKYIATIKGIKDKDINQPRWFNKNKKIKSVKTFFENGGEIEPLDDSGNTFLHYLATITAEKREKPHSEIMTEEEKEAWVNKDITELNELLSIVSENVTNFNVKNFYGRTPLHIAAEKQNSIYTQFLLKKGLNAAEKDKNGDQPLHLLADNIWLFNDSTLNDQIENINNIINMLLENGANINAKNALNKTPFFYLIESNVTRKEDSFPIAKHFLNKGADINSTNIAGNTILIESCMDKDVKCVEFLLNNGADKSIKNYFGKRAIDIIKGYNDYNAIYRLLKNDMGNLYYAAQMGEYDKIESAINEGYNVNRINKKGYTILHIAAEMGHLEIVKLLVENGADINFKGPNGITPIYWATVNNKIEVVKFLLEAGANPFAGFAEKNSLAGLACYNYRHLLCDIILKKAGGGLLHKGVSGRDGIFMMEEEDRRNELEKREKVDIYDDEGNFKQCYLEYSSEGTDRLLHKSVVSKNFSKVNELLAKGCDINEIDNKGKTALMYACEYGLTDMIQYLIDHKADLNLVTNEHISTPLEISLCENQTEAIKVLIDNGYDVNLQDEHGDTVLGRERFIPKERALLYLLEHGIDPNIKNDNGRNALFKAAEENHFDYLYLLAENGGNINAIDNDGCNVLQHFLHDKYKIDESNRKTFNLLLDLGANLSNVDNNGNSILNNALDAGIFPLVKLIIENGTDLEALDLNKNTVLNGLFVLYNDSKSDIAIYLLEHGANVNTPSGNNVYPLSTAVDKSNYELCKAMLEHGANANSVDYNGTTPLYTAVRRKNIEIIELLLKYGADMNLKIKDQWTVIQKAQSYTDDEGKKVLEVLLNYGKEN